MRSAPQPLPITVFRVALFQSQGLCPGLSFSFQGTAMLLLSFRSLTLCLIALSLLLGGLTRPVQAASTFSSGSTGADGPFAPTADVTLQVPDSGVFNFTTVSIPSSVTVTFIRNANNTPVTILASGDVTIGGAIDVSGGNGSTNITTTGPYSLDGTDRTTGGPGGPGGFDGGGGGGITAPFNGVGGDGPGGGGGGQGNSSNNPRGSGGSAGYVIAGADGLDLSGAGQGKGGSIYGDITLAHLIGGSGGGGGGSVATFASGSGGGGGGAILIASSGTMNLSGSFNCHGGNGGSSGSGSGDGGGGGSGGAIRLIATTLSGNAAFNVLGGVGYYYGYNPSGSGGYGVVRLEAYNFNSFSPSLTGGLGAISTATPGPVTPANPPQLQIVSVAGINAPASPLGSLHAPPDIIVKNTVTNPVNVVVKGRNIPTGTIVTVSLIPQTGTETTATAGGLTGTSAASTATASVSLPDGKCVLYASATIDLTSTPGAARLRMGGELVDKILVAATYGGPSQATYVLHSGRKIVFGELSLSAKSAKASRN